MQILSKDHGKHAMFVKMSLKKKKTWLKDSEKSANLVKKLHILSKGRKKIPSKDCEENTNQMQLKDCKKMQIPSKDHKKSDLTATKANFYFYKIRFLLLQKWILLHFHS